MNSGIYFLHGTGRTCSSVFNLLYRLLAVFNYFVFLGNSYCRHEVTSQYSPRFCNCNRVSFLTFAVITCLAELSPPFFETAVNTFRPIDKFPAVYIGNGG
jgi:hypothetical protein